MYAHARFAQTMPRPDSYSEPPPYTDPSATPDQRTFATLMHASVFATPFLLIVGIPLVMWLIKRRDSPFLDDHGKEATNFQISLLIYYLLSGVLTVVLIGFPMLVAVYALGIYGGVKASIAGNRGEYYRYPMTLRLIA